ncbi:MAG: glycosyltransferase [Planctomycetaceae bacterium]|nr:glycosyltransferase [Planctomycetaceae bacterium]
MTSLGIDSTCRPKRPPVALVPLGPLPRCPLVSIVIPSFNQGRFIRETIDSILSQDYRPLEIIVMDGGSRDNTVTVLESYAATPELNWVSRSDGGVVDAVNQGLARATGNVIGIQSSDDAYLPGAIGAVVAAFTSNPAAGLVSGGAVKVDAEGRTLWDLPGSDRYLLRDHLLTRCSVLQCSAFFRRELLEACGGWDEGIPYTPDTDLWIRFAFRTEVQPISRALSRLRAHEDQRDKQVARIAKDYSRMIAQSPDLAGASEDLQRAAEAGKHLIAAKYSSGYSDWIAAWHVWRAGRWVPDVRDRRRTWRLLGRPFQRLGSRLKNLFGVRTSRRSSLLTDVTERG